MKFSQITRSTPNQYVSEKGALQYLTVILERFEYPVIVTGNNSYQAFCQFSNDAYSNIPVVKYDGTSSEEDALRIVGLIEKADVIIGVGGGKVCDTSKMVAEILDVELVLVPTVIGTCAPTTPVAAVYYPNHTFRKIGYFKRHALCCIVDLNLLVNSPAEYFVGGICDTLVKWYEAESIVRHVKGKLEANVQLGLAAAQVTRDILLMDTNEALVDFEQKVISDTFKRIVDTVFNVAAAVGSFACDYGRIAGAHAVHNALSQFPETHAIQHGVKVAYGLLVQLVAMGEIDEVKRLIAFYQANAFIYSFEQLGITENREVVLEQLAQFAASEQESFKLAVPNVTAECIINAINELESIVKGC